jgi:regulator of protease activity HflC (stomatin/prohibitin superfamily)
MLQRTKRPPCVTTRLGAALIAAIDHHLRRTHATRVSRGRHADPKRELAIPCRPPRWPRETIMDSNFPLQFAAGAIAIALIVSGLRVVRQYERVVVFRLGRYLDTRQPGLRWIVPLIDHGVRIDVRTITGAVEKQETITKDNVPVKVNAVLWYRIVDPERSVVAVKEVHGAVTQLALTMLRNIIGQHTMDDVLKERDKLSGTLKESLDRATDPWGVRVEMVEMKNVEIPESMQRAMAQEAEALREKRARIIKAEAELAAAEQFRRAAEVIAGHPASLELRRMQMITELGAEKNTTTIIVLPSEFVRMAEGIAKMGEASAKAA